MYINIVHCNAVILSIRYKIFLKFETHIALPY